ncbi:MAG: DUF3021 domain-containing protein [Terrisporobacter othiniensis]|nr:DUF3021 domain-containing protein [Terrisporobacter othiniensis]MDU6994223.1 DUF3021 domain-containing protein [Terrisporobacter othiniensis]
MNKYFKRGILGFCLGITASIFISLLVSLIIGDGVFHYVSNKLMIYINNELIAVSIQVFLSGILGLVISISMLYLKMESCSLLHQSIIHFTIMLVLMTYIFLLTSLSFLVYFIILILLYFIIWNIQYLVYNYNVNKINKELKKINGEKYSSINNPNKIVDKSLPILLISYLILIVVFVIYDFLEFDLPIYLKYLVLIVTSAVMILENVRLIKSKNYINSILKVISPVVSTVLMILVLVTNYSSFIVFCKEHSIQSTNLSEVYIDGLKVGNSLEKFDNTEYTETDRYNDEKYSFISEEIMIANKNYKISEIYGRVGKVDIIVNGESVVDDLNDIVSKLGNNYVKSNFDSEQLLKQYIYVDKVNDIKVSFIYRDHTYKDKSNKLEYVIISKW